MVPFDTMASGARGPKRAAKPTEFGERVIEACRVAGYSPTRVNELLPWAGGYISRLIGKEGAGDAMSLEKFVQFCDLCHVSYEWLATGRGEMRAKDFKLSAIEDATNSALSFGVPKDVITYVVTRDAGEQRDMEHWLRAMMAENQMRVKVALADRPKEKYRAEVRAEGRKKKRQIIEAESEIPPPQSVPRARRSNRKIAG